MPASAADRTFASPRVPGGQASSVSATPRAIAWDVSAETSGHAAWGVLRGYRLTTGRAGVMLAAVTGTADHVRRKRAVWDRLAAEYAEPGLRMWAEPEPTCGIWNVAETRAGVLPADLEGREFITAGVLDGRRIVAWSLWQGYLKMPSGAALQELLAEHQIRLTSVHASVCWCGAPRTPRGRRRRWSRAGAAGRRSPRRSSPPLARCWPACAGRGWTLLAGRCRSG